MDRKTVFMLVAFVVLLNSVALQIVSLSFNGWLRVDYQTIGEGKVTTKFGLWKMCSPYDTAKTCVDLPSEVVDDCMKMARAFIIISCALNLLSAISMQVTVCGRSTVYAHRFAICVLALQAIFQGAGVGCFVAWKQHAFDGFATEAVSFGWSGFVGFGTICGFVTACLMAFGAYLCQPKSPYKYDKLTSTGVRCAASVPPSVLAMKHTPYNLKGVLLADG